MPWVVAKLYRITLLAQCCLMNLTCIRVGGEYEQTQQPTLARGIREYQVLEKFQRRVAHGIPKMDISTVAGFSWKDCPVAHALQSFVRTSNVQESTNLATYCYDDHMLTACKANIMKDGLPLPTNVGKAKRMTFDSVAYCLGQ